MYIHSYTYTHTTHTPEWIVIDQLTDVVLEQLSGLVTDDWTWTDEWTQTCALVFFCRKAREGEVDANRRLNEMIANYGDVIPRKEYQQLQKQYEVCIKLFSARYTVWAKRLHP